MTPLSPAAVADAIGGRLIAAAKGDVEARLTRLRDPANAVRHGAEPGDVVVVASPTAPEWGAGGEDSGGAGGRWPGLLVLPTSAAPSSPLPCAVVLVDDPRLAFARLSALFSRAEWPPPGRHPSAAVAPDAVLADDVSLATGVVVGAGVRVAEGCAIGANSVIGAGATLGPGCRLHPGVTLYPGVTLGARVELHSGCVIGSDGFGYVAGPRGAEKVHHGGSVVIEDDVEIGANTCVDRGTLGDTRVGARTKIDGMCMIAHNVKIGCDCLIAGQTGIAGSSSVGDRVIIGGAASITDHVRVNDDARIGGRAAVSKDVPAGESWMGNPARPYRLYARDHYLRGRLEEVWRFVRAAARSGGPASEGGVPAEEASGEG